MENLFSATLRQSVIDHLRQECERHLSHALSDEALIRAWMYKDAPGEFHCLACQKSFKEGTPAPESIRPQLGMDASYIDPKTMREMYAGLQSAGEGALEEFLEANALSLQRVLEAIAAAEDEERLLREAGRV